MTTDEDRVLRGVWREIKSYRLRGIQRFEGEIENFILNTFILCRVRYASVTRHNTLYDDEVFCEDVRVSLETDARRFNRHA